MNLLEELNSLRDNEYLLCDSYKVVWKLCQFKKFTPISLYIQEGIKFEEDLSSFFPTTKTLSKDEFKEIKGEKFHKGVIGIFKKPELDDQNSLEAPFVVLNGLTSPENVGSIVRTIAGLGFKSILFDKNTVSPYMRRCIRVSMGNIGFLKVIQVQDLESFIKESHFKIYATANDDGAISIKEWSPEKESGFCIGSEGHGMENNIKAACKSVIKIPIVEGVQHLNAGHSCAIIASRYLI